MKTSANALTMQCYKTESGDLTLFRPKANFARLQRSAARLGLPVSVFSRTI